MYLSMGKRFVKLHCTEAVCVEREMKHIGRVREPIAGMETTRANAYDARFGFFSKELGACRE
jgi:hypothetical protein